MADLLRIVPVDGHANCAADVDQPQSPVLVAAEQVRATVEAAQTHGGRVDARHQLVDAEVRQRTTGLGETGCQLATVELPESLT